MTTSIQHFINGQETPGSGERRQEVFNPATGDVTGTLHLGGQDDLQAAVAAAKKASESWADLSLAKKSAILFKFRELVHAHTDDLARIITAEHGKVLSDAAGEVARGLEVIEFACGISEHLKGCLLYTSPSPRD